MGFQSGINAALGSIAGAAFGIQKTLQQRQTEAMQTVKEKQVAQKKLRRNFKDYLNKLETSLGGTVGELPEKMQKQIAKSYSPQQRKQIMDKMDKEKMNKDGNK